MSQSYSLNDFKTKCFEICKQIVSSHQEVVLHKYGKPFVRVVPYSNQLLGKLGALQGTAILLDDLVVASKNNPIQKTSDVSTSNIAQSTSALDSNIAPTIGNSSNSDVILSYDDAAHTGIDANHTPVHMTHHGNETQNPESETL